MKNLSFLLFLMLFSSILAQEKRVNEEKSKIEFTFIDKDLKGSLDGFTFSGKINLSDISRSEISGKVNSETINTGNFLRDLHLEAKKYFFVKNFPKISFKSSKIDGNSKNFIVFGELTMKGITKKIEFNFISLSNNKLVGNSKINTQDFGISVYKEKERNQVEVLVSLAIE